MLSELICSFFFNVDWRIILCAYVYVLLFPCEVFCSFTIIQMGKSILLVRILLLNAIDASMSRS